MLGGISTRALCLVGVTPPDLNLSSQPPTTRATSASDSHTEESSPRLAHTKDTLLQIPRFFGGFSSFTPRRALNRLGFCTFEQLEPT